MSDTLSTQETPATPIEEQVGQRRLVLRQSVEWIPVAEYRGDPGFREIVDTGDDITEAVLHQFDDGNEEWRYLSGTIANVRYVLKGLTGADWE